MFVLVFNQNNLIPDGQNNKLRFNFPNSVSLKDKYIAVSSISMFYSWFNITAVYQNNYFTYTWTVGSTTTIYRVNIPDGLYQISDLNNLIQFACIANGTYYSSIGGVNYYPFELILNVPRYAVQLNTYLIPTSLGAGFTTPSNFAGFPSNTFNSIVTIPANLNIIIGFSAGFASNNNIGNAYTPPTSNYESKSASGTLSYISTTAPQVQPNNNVLFSISGINNPYMQPSSIIYSLSPNVAVGAQINVTPPNFMWNKFIDGMYNNLVLTLLGNNLQPLILNDPNMCIILTIRDKDEVYGK